MFLPAFVVILLAAPYVLRLVGNRAPGRGPRRHHGRGRRRDRQASRLLLAASVLFPEGLGAPDWGAIAIAVAAFVALQWTRLDVLWVIAGGARGRPCARFRLSRIGRASVTGMKYLHTMVRVGDLEQSLHFYRDLLGLRELRRIENEKGRFTLVFLAAPGDDEAQIELTHNWDPEALLDRPRLRPSCLRGRGHLRDLREAAGRRRHHQPPAARRPHGLRPLARQYLRRAAAERRRPAAARALGVNAEHRQLVEVGVRIAIASARE